MFEPRWALANFYFRSGNGEQFWYWIRSSLDMAHGDLAALWDLAWRATDSPAAVAAVLPGCSAGKALRIGLRQHSIIPGPNAGWSEASLAGGGRHGTARPRVGLRGDPFHHAAAEPGAGLGPSSLRG